MRLYKLRPPNLHLPLHGGYPLVTTLLRAGHVFIVLIFEMRRWKPREVKSLTQAQRGQVSLLLRPAELELEPRSFGSVQTSGHTREVS